MEALQILAKNMEKKKQIRKITMQNRLLMSQKEVLEKSKEITKMVLELPEYQQADTIFCYVDFRNEVRTREIIEDAWKQNKKVAVPKVEGQVMNFYQVRRWTDLKEGYMKILESKEECVKIEVQTEDMLMIMPGVAFDEKCNRIGYGGGYYDRYLAERDEICKIALAFENQIYQELPCEEHDLKPDFVVTEKRRIRKNLKPYKSIIGE